MMEFGIMEWAALFAVVTLVAFVLIGREVLRLGAVVLDHEKLLFDLPGDYALGGKGKGPRRR